MLKRYYQIEFMIICVVISTRVSLILSPGCSELKQ